jgi:hypothetical protein
MQLAGEFVAPQRVGETIDGRDARLQPPRMTFRRPA